jgi:Tfp pilus assembly protein PilN
MDEQIFSQSDLKTSDEALLESYLAEMRRLNAIMRQDQADIDRLKEETNQLKAETQRLREETEATLARLKAAG